jgi:hypothetical protein
MPNLSASDYTSFIKAQAASQAYRNGAVPIPIQTRAQPFATQSILNAQLLTSQAAYVLTPSKIIVDTVGTTVSAARNDILSAAVGNGTIITYTSSIAHGLTNGQTITITGFATLTGANLTGVVTVTGGTSFTIPSAASGTATGTGSITGYVYYTTAAAHTLATTTRNLTITGLSTAAFNLTLVSIALVPSSTVFVISTTATGTAVSGASGVLTLTRYPNASSTIINNARVTPYAGYGNVNNPKSLVTLSQSGTLSSAKTQQLGGLPTTAPKGSGVYAPTPQLARVDTKATGAYRAVRQPV